jgi:hypothetical protein
MKNKVVVLGLSVVVSLWVSFAISVQSAYARNSPRDIGISRCVIQALKRYPAALGGKLMVEKRSASYKLCMMAAGFHP